MRQLLLSLVILVLAASSGFAVAGELSPLDLLERRLARQFPKVANLQPETMQSLVGKKAGEIVVIDVRETSEFGVSHLPGAVRVNPDISQKRFLARFARAARGKTVILYCSVGYRSSKLVAEVQSGLRQAGAKDIYNLSGGIFAWHNSQRSLVRGATRTELVHPYSSRWSHYLTRKKFINYGKNGSSWWNK